MAMESAIFRQKSPHKFSETDPSKFIISRFTHFKQPFSLKNQKTTYSTTVNTFFTVFEISPYLESTTLNVVLLFNTSKISLNNAVNNIQVYYNSITSQDDIYQDGIQVNMD